jgi:hypothetical protein
MTMDMNMMLIINNKPLIINEIDELDNNNNKEIINLKIEL